MSKAGDPNPLDAFITYCRVAQPQSIEDIRRFFEGVICFPYDKELLLQAYLFLNVHAVFPQCCDLLLFEKPPYGEYTNIGKCDFVFMTPNQRLFLIETKYIDTCATGDTERKRRNKHRNKVISQVLTLRQTFCDYWQFEPDCVDCAVFTTDARILNRSEDTNIICEHIAIEDLEEWQQGFRSEL